MRKNHHGKKDRLVKRVFALCLALAVICTCLVPVFATEGGWIATQELDASTQVATMDTAFGVDDGYGIDTQETDAAASTSQSGAVVDSGSTSDSTSSGSTSASTSASTSTSESTASSTTGTSEVITDPSTITDVKIPDGATNIVKNANGSYSYTTEYGRITVFPTKEGEKTTWTDDEVTITPNPNLKEDDAAFGVLPIEYHFWLKQLDSDTFRELDWEAEMAEMSETEYLALFGASEKFPIWHMDTIASTDTISNYKFVNPTAKDDPAGEGREFAYWYTVDENGVESEFNPYKTYGSETATVVNVYAKWKDASGDVVNEDTTKEETTTSGETKANPVEVSAKANIPDYDGEVTVTVTGLPSNVTHLSVTSMGDNSMQSFYELYSSKNKNSTMMPLLGYKISPKNAKGETVQPAKGQKATVTVSGLDKLPEIAAMEEEGALTADALKVLHWKDDGTVETLDVLTYTNGTLTFETSSFSPFVLASVNGYAADTIVANKRENWTVGLNEIRRLDGDEGYYNHQWRIVSSNGSAVKLSEDVGAPHRQFVEGLQVGQTVTIEHTYTSKYGWSSYKDIFKVTVTRYSSAAVFILSNPKGDPDKNVDSVWVPSASENNVIAKVDMTKLNTWIASKDTADSAKNCVDTDEQRTGILEWPDTSPSGREWVINRDDSYFDTVLGWVWDSYKAGIAADMHINPNKIQKSDVDSFTVTVHKISRRNAGTYPTHLDCTISVNNKEYFTAKFWTYNPETHAVEYVDAKDYERNQNVKLTTNDFPQTITGANGTIYKFAGWRVENTDPSSTNLYNPNKTLQWDYEPTDEELVDGVVHFYAIYTPASANLTVTKTVTGKLGDTNKAFTFQILDASGKPVELTTGSYEFGNANGALLNDGTDGKFTLKDGASIIFKNLPSGQYKIVEDDYTGEKYETSYVVDSGTPVNRQEATVTIGTDAKQIDFTNHRTLEPDLGVLLDTLPYIVILAVVVGGGILLMLRKRRKNDD